MAIHQVLQSWEIKLVLKWPCIVLNSMLICSRYLCKIRVTPPVTHPVYSDIQPPHLNAAHTFKLYFFQNEHLRMLPRATDAVIYILLSSQSEHLAGSESTSNDSERKLSRMENSIFYAFKWEIMDARVFLLMCISQLDYWCQLSGKD